MIAKTSSQQISLAGRESMLCLQNIDSKIRLYNLSSVIGHLGVTVLPILITLKFVHKKFQQKYRWIEHVNIYHYAKSEVEQKFGQEEIKKRNLLLNSCGLTVHLRPVTRYYL